MKITMMKKKNDGVSSRRLTNMTTTKEKKKNDDDEDDEESSRPPPPRSSSSSSSSTDMATAWILALSSVPKFRDLPELFLRNSFFFLPPKFDGNGIIPVPKFWSCRNSRFAGIIPAEFRFFFHPPKFERKRNYSGPTKFWSWTQNIIIKGERAQFPVIT